MKTNQYNRILAALLLAGSLTLPAAAAHAAELKAFATPDAAMEAFGAALQDDDEAVKEAVLGKNFREVIPPVGADLRYRFLENWAKLHKIEMDGENKARIAVGDSGWTLRWPGLLALFGVRQQSNILNPQTVLALPQDLAALEWMDDNLPADARVAVSAWPSARHCP